MILYFSDFAFVENRECLYKLLTTSFCAIVLLSLRIYKDSNRLHENSVLKMEWINPFSSLTEDERSHQPQHKVLAKDMLPTVNPYHILQVRRDATTSEIRKSYRRLALLNHPGRGHDSGDQRKRRLQMFEILAASYEALVGKESRRRFDLHLSVVENLRFNRGLAGEMFIGGKRLGTRPIAPETPIQEIEILPRLVRSDSSSSCSSTPSDSSSQIFIKSTTHTNTVVVTTTTNNTETDDSVTKAEILLSAAESERLFGGLLLDLFRARNFEPFTDSLVVFEEVFGSQMFDVSRDEIGRLKAWEPIQDLAFPAGWEGSSRTSHDGKTTVFTTSRILHDRRVTRIETITEDPRTGRRQKHTTVTSQPLEPEVTEEEAGVCFGHCGYYAHNNSESTEESSSFKCTDFLYSYYEICSQFGEEFQVFGAGYWNLLLLK
jgi:hypothetical protein